jgi:hypothetical protein
LLLLHARSSLAVQFFLPCVVRLQLTNRRLACVPSQISKTASSMLMLMLML